MRKLAILTLGCGLLLTRVMPASCASLAGVVTNLQGQPVSGIKISVQNSAKQILGQALTDTNGHYQITGIAPNTYDYLLNPMNTGYKNGSAVSYLGPKGLVINWKVSDSRGVLALAVMGSGGLSALEVGSIVALGAGVVGAGVVGGYGAAGGFSGNNTPSSSSM
jgi:hypothetical protein